MAARVLILTASIGEGHDLPARTLAAQLREESPDVAVEIEDGLVAMGRLVTAVSEDASRVVFFRGQWVWDVGFWAFSGAGPTRRVTQALLDRAGSPGLLRLVRDRRPDVVVSTFPQTTEVLARLRRRGDLDIPVVSAVTDIGPLHYWVAPGVDVHLVTFPESVPEVRSIAGAAADVRCVHGLTVPDFATPRDPASARRALGLPADGKVVLVSGGGWGVGDLDGAVRAALTVDDVVRVVCLCGRNEGVRRRLLARYRGAPRVQVEGFTDRMADWLAAGDVLIHSTGGLTVLEAQIRGCPVISYGWGRGHLRPQNAAFARHGLAEVITGSGALPDAIRRAVSTRLPPDLTYGSLPSAASVVLGLVDGRATPPRAAA